MYRGELACCRTLYAADAEFEALKRRAERYPAALKSALIGFFSFECGFSCEQAEKGLRYGDVSYVAGNLFRSVSALNQILFARNEQWCLNEKKAVFRIDGFPIRPEGYSRKVSEIFAALGAAPDLSVQRLRALSDEVSAVAKD